MITIKKVDNEDEKTRVTLEMIIWLNESLNALVILYAPIIY